jgi:hypothetical protein
MNLILVLITGLIILTEKAPLYHTLLVQDMTRKKRSQVPVECGLQVVRLVYDVHIILSIDVNEDGTPISFV